MSIRMSTLINLITKVKGSLLVVLLLVCSAVLSAPVQSTNTVGGESKPEATEASGPMILYPLKFKVMLLPADSQPSLIPCDDVKVIRFSGLRLTRVSCGLHNDFSLLMSVTMSTNDQHNDHPPKPTQDHSPGCHFKNTEIALPITFSLEMPSYVMVGGHKFNLKLQMPNINI